MIFFSKWRRRLFILCLLFLNNPVFGVEEEKDSKMAKSEVLSSGFGDLDSIIPEIKSKKISVLLPEVVLEEHKLFNVLFALKTNSYDDIEIEDLDADTISVLEKELGLGLEMERLKKSIHEDTNIISALKGFQKVSKRFERKVDPLIIRVLERYRQDSYQRLESTLRDIGENTEKGKEDDHLFMVVLPEAFFNYFKTPQGFGSFIPFADKRWLRMITQASTAHKNVIFVANIIHVDDEQDKSKFEINFRQFIAGSYNQKGILSDYYRYHNKITPIFNETFVFYCGAILGCYKKQYILDEDVPMLKTHEGDSFLGKQNFLYTPGNHDQALLKGLFSVQVCQDHVRIQEEIKSPYFILQSASIDVRGDLKTKFRNGTCIHSDIDSGKSKVYHLIDGVLTVVSSVKFSPFQRYNLY